MSNPNWGWTQQYAPPNQNPPLPTTNAQRPFVNFTATQSGSMNGAYMPTTNQNSGQQFPQHAQYNYGTMTSQGEQGSSNWQQQFQHYNPQNLSLTNGLPRRSVACEACRKARRRCVRPEIPGYDPALLTCHSCMGQGIACVTKTKRPHPST